MQKTNKRCGFVSLVGRPNVGKSTLLNHIIKQKLSITSRKPQTTRQRIIGIKTVENYQIVFVDTPGLHKKEAKAINRYMNQEAKQALRDVDLVIMLVDGLKWTEDDDWVLSNLAACKLPVMLAINKIDRIKPKKSLLPHVEKVKQKFEFCDIVPVSALKQDNLERLENLIVPHLPLNDFSYAEDELTNKSLRFLCSELIREKIMRQLSDELPYEVAVEIEKFNEEESLTRIYASILINRPGQKKIIIGSSGQRLKKIGSLARIDIEKLLDKKVMLSLWVKLRKGWSDDDRALLSLGYHQD